MRYSDYSSLYYTVGGWTCGGWSNPGWRPIVLCKHTQHTIRTCALRHALDTWFNFYWHIWIEVFSDGAANRYTLQVRLSSSRLFTGGLQLPGKCTHNLIVSRSLIPFVLQRKAGSPNINTKRRQFWRMQNYLGPLNVIVIIIVASVLFAACAYCAQPAHNTRRLRTIHPKTACKWLWHLKALSNFACFRIAFSSYLYLAIQLFAEARTGLRIGTQSGYAYIFPEVAGDAHIIMTHFGRKYLIERQSVSYTFCIGSLF